MNQVPLPIKKLCAYPGCNTRIDLGQRHCEAHARKERQIYDARRADDPHRKFLSSSRWRRFRAAFLAQHPVCGCGERATEVHHTESRRGGADPFDASTCIGLCKRCHSRESVLSGERFGGDGRGGLKG